MGRRTQKYPLWFPLASVLLSLLALFAVMEVCARLFLGSPCQDQRSYLTCGNKVVHCYATDLDHAFPLDLNKPKDLAFLFSILPFPEKGQGVLLPSTKDEKANLPREALSEYLKEKTPHCIVYDISPSSVRRFFRPPHAEGSLALLGDSFAFGQGVGLNETYGYNLAEKLHAQVVNYGDMGANILEKATQFQRAMEDRKQYGFKMIVFLFVLAVR